MMRGSAGAVRSALASNTGVLLSSTIAGQAILLVAAPLLSRLFSPGDFGTYAVVNSLLSILTVTVAFGMETAILVSAGSRERRALWWVAVLGSVIAVLGLVAVGTWLLAAGGATDSSYLLFSVAALLVPSVVLTASENVALVEGSVAYVRRATLTRNGSQAGSQVALGVAGSGSAGLIGGLLAGRFFASITFIRMLGIRRPPPARDLKAAISRHRRFLWLSTPAQFANSVGLYVAPLLIARAFSARQAGYFALANQSLAVPLSFIGVGLAQAYVASASRSAKEDSGALLALFRRTVKRLAVVGIAAILPLAVLAPTLFALFFGDRWREAGVYAQILAPMFFCQLISSPVSQSLNLVGRQHHQLAWDVSRSVGVVAAFFLAQLNGASARGTVAAYSVTMALFYLTHLAMSSRALRTDRGEPTRTT